MSEFQDDVVVMAEAFAVEQADAELFMANDAMGYTDTRFVSPIQQGTIPLEDDLPF
jgi:ABC-type dipeptide/oligopeptide/nickel transport system ATPase component